MKTKPSTQSNITKTNKMKISQSSMKTSNLKSIKSTTKQQVSARNSSLKPINEENTLLQKMPWVATFGWLFI